MSEQNENCGCKQLFSENGVVGIDPSTCRYPLLKEQFDEAVGKIQEEIHQAINDLRQYPMSEALPIKINWLRFALAALGVKEVLDDK